MNEFTEYEVLRFMPIKLPYHYKGLEPYIDEETMQIHYNKHYIGYLNKLNRAVEKYDIADDIGGQNYTLRHLNERVNIYNEENFKYEVIKLNLKAG